MDPRRIDAYGLTAYEKWTLQAVNMFNMTLYHCM